MRSVSRRDFEVTIKLKKDWKPFHARNKGGESEEEEKQMRTQLNELLAKGFIEASESMVSSNLKYAAKPGTTKKRLCTNY